MDAIFAQGDSPKHLIYGLLNSIDDPDKPTKKGGKRKLPEIASTIFHRSQENPDTLPYSAFGTDAPRGFLPELRTIDTTPYDASVTKTKTKAAKKKKSGGPPPIHVHHKFIVIDGDTDAPTIYSGSPNFSKASENSNDENVLEIKGNVALAHAYVAEFMDKALIKAASAAEKGTDRSSVEKLAPQLKSTIAVPTRASIFLGSSAMARSKKPRACVMCSTVIPLCKRAVPRKYKSSASG